MASAQPGKASVKEQLAPHDVVSIDLPAPQGWSKKFTPKKGGTPRRNEIIFISPSGEEIKNRRQLDRFLKSHPGGPSLADFDWGTGDTPRRSARISGKSKATETPKGEPPRKKQTKSNLKKGLKEKNDDTDGVDEVAEKEAAVVVEGTEASDEVEIKDTKDAGEVAGAEDMEKETKLKPDGKVDEMDIEKLQSQEVDNATVSDTKEETNDKPQAEPEASPGLDSKDALNKTEELPNTTGEGQIENKPLPEPGLEKRVEVKKRPAEAEAPPAMPEKEVNAFEDAAPEVDAKLEKESDAKVGQEKSSLEKEASTEGAASVGEVKRNNESLKDNQELSKPSESCTQAPHEPKASHVSC